LSSVRSTRSQHANIPVIGIVGGVGAGKSSVIRNVSSLRLHVVDADHIGHEQLVVPEIRDRIVGVFGTRVLDDKAVISRPHLAAEVFGDSIEQQQKRQQLNAIVHPAIRSEMRRQIKAVSQDADAIILDAALLLEAGWADECDAVIFINTALEQRRKRVAETRGWSSEEHARREASQWGLDKKRQFCEFVVDNSGSPEVASQQMEQTLKLIVSRHSHAT
jgi:dephospho-CoA kinase